MKKIILLLAFFIFLIPSYAISLEDAGAADDGLTSGALENIYKVDENFSFMDITKNITEGHFSTDLKGVASKGLSVFFKEVSSNVKIMSALLLLGIFCTLLTNMQSSFGHVGTGEAAFFCCYAVLAGIAAVGFKEAADMVNSAMDSMNLFVESMIPAITSLSIAQGKIVSAPIMNTQILIGASLCDLVVKKIVMPLTYGVFALRFVNNMTQTQNLTKLCELMQKTAKWILGLMLLLFTAILSITNYAAGTTETLSLKTAKFAVRTFIPVAGGALSDTVSALTASAGAIKSAVGIAGIVVIALISAYPLIKAAALTFLYNVMAAVLEPVSDTRMSKAVGAIGECMGMLFAQLAVSAVMMIMSTAILITASGFGG
ncbi:MAG: stage III sporulation protein AE [Bacillota bacterium]|nr:stage III sporulation protein AE [Bacillota bacterium]